MAVFAVSITKSCQWRGQTQEFSNVYHFKTDTLETFLDGNVIDYLVTAEKPLHSSLVTFLRGRTWGPTDQGPAASVTRLVKDVSGVGAAAASTSVYKECALLLQFPLGRYGVRNHPQKLRKWIHTVGNPEAYPLDGSGKMAAPSAAMTTYRDRIRTLDPTAFPGQYELCSPTGHVPIDVGVWYPYLEHRQFGR